MNLTWVQPSTGPRGSLATAPGVSHGVAPGSINSEISGPRTQYLFSVAEVRVYPRHGLDPTIPAITAPQPVGLAHDQPHLPAIARPRIPRVVQSDKAHRDPSVDQRSAFRQATGAALSNSPPSFPKDIRVLEESGLIGTRKEGRVRTRNPQHGANSGHPRRASCGNARCGKQGRTGWRTCGKDVIDSKER